MLFKLRLDALPEAQSWLPSYWSWETHSATDGSKLRISAAGAWDSSGVVSGLKWRKSLAVLLMSSCGVSLVMSYPAMVFIG